MKQRFFICDRCGNIVAFVKESGVDVVCCEEFMKELVPRTVDVSSEKHAPVYMVKNGVVEVSAPDNRPKCAECTGQSSSLPSPA